MHEVRGHLVTFASILALAGTLVAGGHQPAFGGQPADDVICTGCVDTSDIADDAVTGGKIADGTVGSADIADGAVGSADIGEGAGITVPVNDIDQAPPCLEPSPSSRSGRTNHRS